MSKRKALIALGVVLALLGGWWFAQQQHRRAGQRQSRQQLAEQQELVAAWFADCQGCIERLDRTWQLYERVNTQFQRDEISIETAYVRLQALHEESERHIARLPSLEPPLALEGDNYDLAAVCYHRLADYAKRQHDTLELAATTAGQSRGASWEEQTRRLAHIRVMNTPPALFIAAPLAQLRDNVDPELAAER